MFNMITFSDSNGRAGTWGYHFANSGQVSTAGASQATALGARPSIFWNGHSAQYISDSSGGSFINQNNNIFYSVWRLTDGSNIVNDIVGGNKEALLLLNLDASWDDQLFTVNGQGKGNTANGTPLSKLGVPASYTDFSASRPLLMSLVGGLPRNGGDIMDKSESSDAYWLTGDHDYYLSYYPKYDGTSRKLLAKNDGLDWYGLQSRTQIDGSQPVAQQAAEAASFATGYSRVGSSPKWYDKLNIFYNTLDICNLVHTVLNKNPMVRYLSSRHLKN